MTYDSGPPTAAWDDDGRPSDELTDFGPYRILEQLGSGGMGSVYLAEQTEPFTRRVAIKVIKLGMDSAQILARFEFERQALALMDHDAIAKVFDAGTTARGQPYVVMEYVDGEPLDRYADRHGLSLAARLRLFQAICDGVQHAHQKGVIHRDLKPGNVLVHRDGAADRPKIIDFGLARATDLELGPASLSVPGALIGTPEYMAPEQARGDVAAIDSRTDVYALGTLLYELLSGELPFASTTLRSAGLAEIQRVLTEDDPPKPSSRVSSSIGPDEAAADRRRTTTSLARELRGDLDWIVMKALAKEPERRYASAAALAADVARHLAHEPVEAGPPSAAYRWSKFARRYRVQVAAGVLILLTLAVATATSLAFAFAADAAAELATTNEGIARSEAAAAARARDAEATQRRSAERARDETRVALAKLAAREGDWETALAQVDSVLAAATALDATELRVQRAEYLLAAGQNAAAAAELDAVIESLAGAKPRGKLALLDARRRAAVANPFKTRKIFRTLLADGDLTAGDRALAEIHVVDGLAATVDALWRAHEAAPYHRDVLGMLIVLTGLFGSDDELRSLAARVETLLPGSDDVASIEFSLALRGLGRRPKKLAGFDDDLDGFLRSRALMDEAGRDLAFAWDATEREAAGRKFSSGFLGFMLRMFSLFGRSLRETGVSNLGIIQPGWVRDLYGTGLRSLGVGLGTRSRPSDEEFLDETAALVDRNPIDMWFILRSTRMRQLGDLLAAEQEARRAIDARFLSTTLAPTQLFAWVQLIECQVDLARDPDATSRQREDAAARLTQSTATLQARWGNDPRCASWIARRLRRAGDLERARVFALLYASQAPTDPRSAYLAALVSADVENWNDAERYLDRAERLAHDPDDCAAIRTRITAGRDR